MLEAAQWFGVLEQFTGCSSIPEPVGINNIPMDCGKEYLAIRRHTKENPNLVNRQATKKEKKRIAMKMWTDLKNLLVKLQGPEHKEQIFNYIIKAAFGEDADNIIDMGASGIKEIRKADMEALKNDASLHILPVNDGNYLRFYRKPLDGGKVSPDDLLYHFRVKISHRTNSKGKESLDIKFYPEVGNLSYSKKDEEWYCKKYPSSDGCESVG